MVMNKRNRLAGLLAAAWYMALLPLSAEAKLRIFVANSGDDTVSVIDGDLDREVATIPVGTFPQGLALRERDPLLAVANSRGQSVTLIDPVSLEKVEKAIRVGHFPVSMAFSPDGGLLYCACYDDRSVVVVDVAARATAGEPIPIGSVPGRLALSPDGTRLYVLQYQDVGAVVVVDTATRAVIGSVGVGPFPTDLALSPDGTRLFAASFNADTLTVIDPETLEPLDTFEMRIGNGLLIHPRKPLLYSMVTFDEEVAVVDYAAKREVAAIPVGQDPVYSAISPDGRFVYAVNGTDNNVMKIDTETNEVLLRIAVGVEPFSAVAFQMGRPMGRVALLAGLAIAAALAATGALLWRRRG